MEVSGLVHGVQVLPQMRLTPLLPPPLLLLLILHHRESDGGFEVEQQMGWSHSPKDGWGGGVPRGGLGCVSTEPVELAVLPGNPWQQLLHAAESLPGVWAAGADASSLTPVPLEWCPARRRLSTQHILLCCLSLDISEPSV